MMRILRTLVPLLILLPQLGAVTIGQMETFDTPDHDWVVGAGPMVVTPTPVPIETTGGKTGDDDPYLNLVSAGGSGPGSRLTAQNFGDWAGNYIAAGVNRIRMDVRNFGNTDLSLRLLFVEFDQGAPVSAAFSGVASLVLGGSDWQTIEFNVSPSALMPIPVPFLPIADPLRSLSNAGELRIFHNPDPFFAVGSNPPVVGNLGVDNITAAFVPEPVSWALVCSGLLAAALARRSKLRH